MGNGTHARKLRNKTMTDEERLNKLKKYVDENTKIKYFIKRELFAAMMKKVIGTHYWMLGI